MNILVTTEERFVQTPDGTVWSGGSGVHTFWLRYHAAFDSVRVLARIAKAETVPVGWQKADGAGVSFAALPHFVGVREQLQNFGAIRAAVKQAVNGSDAIILRAFSVIAPYVVSQLPATRPFGVEVVGDPHEVFGPFADPHPARPLLRWWFTHQLKQQCRRACAVAYVSGHELPGRYPKASGALSTVYSSIELTEESFVPAPRQFEAAPRPLRVVSVGSIERLYKGFDTLIEAAAICKQTGTDVRIRIIGEGRCRPQLERIYRQHGLESEVTFTGRIPSGQAVREELDRSDLFVLASKTEGLPRAMIEAMARALPCVGTAVGGIPELLSDAELVPRGDSSALARKIVEFTSDTKLLNAASARNLAKARLYHSSVLAAQRKRFYEFVRSSTETWNTPQLAESSNNYTSPIEVSGSNPSRS